MTESPLELLLDETRDALLAGDLARLGALADRTEQALAASSPAGLAEPESDPARAPQTDRRAAPRFRLESIFRF